MSFLNISWIFPYPSLNLSLILLVPLSSSFFPDSFPDLARAFPNLLCLSSTFPESFPDITCVFPHTSLRFSSYSLHLFLSLPLLFTCPPSHTFFHLVLSCVDAFSFSYLFPLEFLSYYIISWPFLMLFFLFLNLSFIFHHSLLYLYSHCFLCISAPFAA